MQNSIICTNCKCKMHLLKIGLLLILVMFKTLILKHLLYLHIGLKTHLKRALGLTTIMDIEHDEDYISSVKKDFSNNTEIDDSINLTRISRLKQRAQERKIEDNYE